MGDSNAAEEEMATDTKMGDPRDGTPSSIESSPEQEPGAEPEQEPVQPQKRKGGRKPIYATSEERKQRNRQAQAAFRERRTEYIKQLEATIKQNEETLSSLQQSHRSAADECLMLRYKNSLLERILLEKGIDVQAELQMKTGSPTLGFHHPAANIPQIPPPQPPLQRAAIQRHHARRSGHNFLPKLAPGQSNSEVNLQNSPPGHPTPSSHASSPTSIPTRSPLVMQQGGSATPTSAVLAQPHAQRYHDFAQSSQHPPNQAYYQRQPMSPNAQRPGLSPHYQSNGSNHMNHSASHRKSLSTPLSAPAGSDNAASSYYPSPSFQKHIDQLEHEYDTQQTRSMLDQTDIDDGSDPSPDQLHGNYPPQFDRQHPPSGEYYQSPMSGSTGQQQMSTASQLQSTNHPSTTDGGGDSFGSMGEIIDPNDPMLDADPFGLSASMHYPTSYSFEQPAQRS